MTTDRPPAPGEPGGIALESAPADDVPRGVSTVPLAGGTQDEPRRIEILLPYGQGRDNVGFYYPQHALVPVQPKGFLPVAEGGFYVDDTANRAIKRFRSDGTAELVIPYPDEFTPARTVSWLGVSGDAVYLASRDQAMCVGLDGSLRWMLSAPGPADLQERKAGHPAGLTVLRNGVEEPYSLASVLPTGWSEAGVVGGIFSRCAEYDTAMVADADSVRLTVLLQSRTDWAAVLLELTHDGRLVGKPRALIRNANGEWYDLSGRTTSPRMHDWWYDLSVPGHKSIKRLGPDGHPRPALEVPVPALLPTDRKLLRVDWLVRPDGSLLHLRHYATPDDRMGLQVIHLSQDGSELSRLDVSRPRCPGLPVRCHLDPNGDLWTWQSTDDGVRLTKYVF